MLAFEIFCVYVSINCLMSAYMIRKVNKERETLRAYAERASKELGVSRTTFLASASVIFALGMLPITIFILIKGVK